MGPTIRRLSLGLSLIALASAVLVISETPRAKEVRTTPNAQARRKPVKVALFQMASQPIIEEGVAGVLDSLKDKGYADGQLLHLTRFNAEGDMATANTIARELVGGQYDLVITVTTGALQVTANANKAGHVRHVFGLVSDPVKAGVGIGTEPLDHPPHLVGIGTFPPVDEALRLARRLNPKLRRIGLAWNPAEVNSEVCTVVARKTCRELDLELLEANVENAVAVKEAVDSLVNRQAEALLIGGDVTVLSAMELVVRAGNEARIPVFTCMPGNAKRGSLFDVGANYYEVGRSVGRLAARVLDGEPIPQLPVEFVIPPKLFLNKLATQNLREGWDFPAEVLQQADSVIDESGQHDKKPADVPPTPSAASKKRWELRIVAYVNSPEAEDSERGLRDGLKQAGLVEGRDYAMKVANAQGDMVTLNGLVDAALADRADLLLTISTPALQCAMQRTRGTPIVFAMVTDPFAAGAGTSDADHRPEVTGAYGAIDADGMMPILRQVLPGAKRLGALFVPAEVNSVYNHDLLKAAAKSAGYELMSVGVNSASEAPDATRSLCDARVDGICLPNSNLAASSYPTIAQSAAQAKIPVFGFLGGFAPQGAVAVLSRDYHDMAVESGRIAARVIRGESPAAIPFQRSQKSRLLVNTAAARACGIELPDALLKSAERVFDE